jgi:arylsulfatase A-like enzyme
MLLLALLALLPLELAAPSAKSNIIFVLTDDQDLVFDSMRAMPFTTQFFGGGGATFTQAFAHTPVCCPSRGEILTGRYLHNLKAADASVNTCMRLNVDAAFESRVLANDLQRAGYRTMMAGKYLNGKGVSHCPAPGGPRAAPPPGWDRYFVMCPDTCYVDCLFGDDGVARWYNDTAFVNGTNYAPAIIGNVSAAFIRETLSAPAAARKPLFAYVAVHSPHTPSTPAPWYSHTYPFVRAPRTASYNVSAPDHHWAVRVQPPIDFLVELNMDKIARNRLQTLLTVDDMVREFAELVGTLGAMQNTFWFFTSECAAATRCEALCLSHARVFFHLICPPAPAGPNLLPTDRLPWFLDAQPWFPLRPALPWPLQAHAVRYGPTHPAVRPRSRRDCRHEGRIAGGHARSCADDPVAGWRGAERSGGDGWTLAAAAAPLGANAAAAAAGGGGGGFSLFCRACAWQGRRR